MRLKSLNFATPPAGQVFDNFSQFKIKYLY